MNKIWRVVLNILISPFTVGIVATFFMIYIALTFYFQQSQPEYKRQQAYDSSPLFQYLSMLHSNTVDLRLRSRGLRKGTDQVAVLTIDEKSIEKLGRWPWSRDKIAKIVDRLVDQGAKVIAFDIVFSEDDDNSARRALAELKSNMGQKRQVASLIDSKIKAYDTDSILEDTIRRRADNLVMGAYFDSPVFMYAGFSTYKYLCHDYLVERTFAFNRWADQEKMVLTLDTNDVVLPEAMMDYLDEQFDAVAERSKVEYCASRKAINQDSYKSILSVDNKKAADHKKELIDQFVEYYADNTERLNRECIGLLKHQEKIDLALKTDFDQQKKCSTFLDEDQEEELDEIAEVWEDVIEEYPSLEGLAFNEGLDRFKGMHLLSPIEKAGRWWIDIKRFAKNEKHIGYFNAYQDQDGSIRKSTLIAKTGSQYVPSMALKSFMIAKGYSGVLMKLERNPRDIDGETKIVSSLLMTDEEGNPKGPDGKPIFEIPVDTEGRMLINYAGPRQMFAYVSAADVLEEGPLVIQQRVPASKITAKKPETFFEKFWHFVTMGSADATEWEQKEITIYDREKYFKDKVFIVGATATGVYDLRVTPFEENFPGLETHVNVVDNLLRADFLKVHQDEELYMPLTLLALGIILSFALGHLGAMGGLMLTTFLLVCIYFVDRYYLFGDGIVVAVIFPLFLTGGIYITLTFYKYFTEERKKKELKGTFAKYVSPAIVDEILADPGNIELGGRKENITVFFSDVRGFTTISEKLDPKTLSDLLNYYLTPMTELVFANKGTLDKYMGDAVMAFFGAPIKYDDHAKMACRCALKSLDKLWELQEEFKEKNLPMIDIGIGLNTGEMSVGNMGSDIVRNYTVMGDAVNLGSRLEGINKQYGTRIIISEFTEVEIRGDFVTREIDWVKVKGKEEPVRIYELMAEETTTDQQLRDIKKWFDQGFQAYHAQKWDAAIEAFNEALNVNPGDECSKLYIDRCQNYKAEPPGENWDGVFIMTSK